MKEVKEREKIMNGHSAMLIKITGMGNVWGHGPRMRSSKMTKSKNTASLFLLLKDHKTVLESRGVVSANRSNTLQYGTEEKEGGKWRNIITRRGKDILDRRGCDSLVPKHDIC